MYGHTSDLDSSTTLGVGKYCVYTPELWQGLYAISVLTTRSTAAKCRIHVTMLEHSVSPPHSRLLDRDFSLAGRS